MKTIIVKFNPFLEKGTEQAVEEIVRDSINRQRGTGVIVLPNYVSYEGTINEVEDAESDV